MHAKLPDVSWGTKMPLAMNLNNQVDMYDFYRAGYPEDSAVLNDPSPVPGLIKQMKKERAQLVEESKAPGQVALGWLIALLMHTVASVTVVMDHLQRV